jgi:hypothetical protein
MGDGDGGSLNQDGAAVAKGFAACVTSTAAAKRSGENLIIMYDASGSMGDPAEGGDPKTKWLPLQNGMKAFFADPASAWISASLQFFPLLPSNVSAPSNLMYPQVAWQQFWIDQACGYPYATPAVPLTSLAMSQSLLDAVAMKQPQGGTPTLPALQGAIKYAQGVATGHPDDKTAVVLVTDGDPGFYIATSPSQGYATPGCMDNDVTHVADAASAAFKGSPSVPTYVISVGTLIDGKNADAIASAGGTGHAYPIAVNDPAQTASSFTQALSSIRTLSFSCSIEFPQAPAGQMIDPDLVNLAFTPSKGSSQVIDQDPACTGGKGWHYDDPKAPKALILCDATCNAVREDPGSKLDLELGCSTVTVLR